MRVAFRAPHFWLLLSKSVRSSKPNFGILHSTMTDTTNNAEYVPPKVWTWDPEAKTGGFLNRPIAGATHEAALPVGKHPLQLYSMGTPNGQKVTILLEELLDLGHKGAEYDAWLIEIGKGDQFGSEFVEANPNSKIPTLVDRSGDEPMAIFESGSILLQLAERFGEFIPKDPKGRNQVLCWLFWQVGSAPYLGGGFGHFYNYAPVKIQYAIDRFTMETKRQLDVLDKQLAKNRFIAGDEYTIADVSIFPWYGNVVFGKAYNAGEFLDVKSYTNVIRWANEIAARPAVKRGLKVNKIWGEPDEMLRERHDASDFETKA